MKPIKILSSLASAVLVLSLTACGGSGGDKETPSVRVSPSSLTFSDAGGSQTVSVTANVDWNASSSDSWVTVSPASGKSSGTAQQLSVTVGKNSSLDRNATITVKSIDGTLTGTIAVTQTAYMPTEINDITAKNAAAVSNPYKYQKYRLSGTVKSLQGNGSFNLIDDSGSLPVAGLNSSDAGYGKQGGALSNVKERDNVTVVGYLEQVGGKMTLVYAYLEKVDSYVEPDPSTAATKNFPYTVDYTAADGGIVINNPTFPLVFDAIWTRSSSTGWQASGYTGGTSYTTESWLYTEKVNLSGAKKPILVFDHIVRNFNDIETAKDQTSVWISVDGGKFQKLAISFSYPDEQGSSVMTSENVGLSAFIGKTVQFGFRYVSDQSKEAGTWCILKVQAIEDEEPEQPGDSGGAEDYDKPGWDWNN